MHFRITKLHKEIAFLLSEGYTAKGIGEAIGCTNRKIENIIGKMLLMTNCKNSAQMVAYFLRNKIID